MSQPTEPTSIELDFRAAPAPDVSNLEKLFAIMYTLIDKKTKTSSQPSRLASLLFTKPDDATVLAEPVKISNFTVTIKQYKNTGPSIEAGPTIEDFNTYFGNFFGNEPPLCFHLTHEHEHEHEHEIVISVIMQIRRYISPIP
jgi:hypothetical protein